MLTFFYIPSVYYLGLSGYDLSADVKTCFLVLQSYNVLVISPLFIYLFHFVFISSFVLAALLHNHVISCVTVLCL